MRGIREQCQQKKTGGIISTRFWFYVLSESLPRDGNRSRFGLRSRNLQDVEVGACGGVSTIPIIAGLVVSAFENHGSPSVENLQRNVSVNAESADFKHVVDAVAVG